MSEADNRDTENLLLLCLPHAWEIDAVADQYPADLLREWKKRQVADTQAAQAAQSAWRITDAQATEAVAPFELDKAIERVASIVPFNPRMRSRTQAWQLAVRKASGRRLARLMPLVRSEHRDAVLTWMATDDQPTALVPAGSVRVLIARMGAGKSEQAGRWWEEGLHAAASSEEFEIGAWFSPRTVVGSLESALISELGSEPTRSCRIVIDDLDSVSPQDAARLLAQARELVQVWPNVSVLATARPSVPVPDEERLVVEPWSTSRGAGLLRAALGDDRHWPTWNGETLELLKNPLTILGLAGRLLANRAVQISRPQLLADLAELAIELRHEELTHETWNDMARLAMQILGGPGQVSASSFASWPRLHRLLASDMVVADGSSVTFALPVFEQYFGREAIRTGLVTVEEAAAGDAFPRWRYALAFAVSIASPPEQEQLMLRLAMASPAAVFWILKEIGDPTRTQSLEGEDDTTIATFISRRANDHVAADDDLAIRAGMWLREAEETLLAGLGPLAEAITGHREGKLSQWGVWLQGGYLSLARARDTMPPPAVVRLPEMHPKIRGSKEWRSWTAFRFPASDLGRWDEACERLQEHLAGLIVRRTLPVPSRSWLARERMYHLASFVYDFGVSRRPRPIDLADLREKVSSWLDQVNSTQWSSWGSNDVDSDDVRWLAAELATLEGEHLSRPWPKRDRPHGGQWIWQGFSPELTLVMATDMVREALIGYRQLVETNFPRFGDAMGLYSMLPLDVEGTIERPEGNSGWFSLSMTLLMHPQSPKPKWTTPSVSLNIVTDRTDLKRWEREQEHQFRHAPIRFGQSGVQELEVPLHTSLAATELAYQWLTADLAELGIRSRHGHFLR